MDDMAEVLYGRSFEIKCGFFQKHLVKNHG
jgi:hypothetical protein